MWKTRADIGRPPAQTARPAPALGVPQAMRHEQVARRYWIKRKCPRCRPRGRGGQELCLECPDRYRRRVEDPPLRADRAHPCGTQDRGGEPAAGTGAVRHRLPGLRKPARRTLPVTERRRAPLARRAREGGAPVDRRARSRLCRRTTGHSKRELGLLPLASSSSPHATPQQGRGRPSVAHCSKVGALPHSSCRAMHGTT